MTSSILLPQLWPDSAALHAGRLHLGGCNATALAAEYGTPLYVFDEATLRGTMRTYRAAFARAYAEPGSSHDRNRGLAAQFGIHYASKALLNIALAQLVAQEGLGLDVVSGAELLVARRAEVPMQQVHFHGNAKTRAELERALDWGVGAIVVDNLDELDQLVALSGGRGAAGQAAPQGVLLRLAPNIDAHTHAYIATGSADSKFGLPLAALDAAAARVLNAPGLRLLGLHAHIGSQLFDDGAIRATVGVLLEMAVRLRERFGLVVAEISPGGGLGVPYTAAMPPTDIDAYARALVHAVSALCDSYRLPVPRLTVEPGRSIVARAGVALYRVLARKYTDAPSPLVQYLHIDGGMADNIRPALYGARYTALLANRTDDAADTRVHVAGRYCESGDVLLRDALLPPAVPGDLLAVAVAGAYTLSMASTYNLVPRPAALLVGDGRARLIQRRETEDDLLLRDMTIA